MTGYFDTAEREAAEAARAFGLDAVALVEERVIADVNLITGDREFPDDLRERIQGCIAVCRAKCPSGIPTKGERYVEMVKRSKLLGELHSLFHEVARRRVRTRFGFLSDNPRASVVARDDHDGGDDDDL